MPRENRKRGKKYKKKQEQHEIQIEVIEPRPPQGGPSWIVPHSSSKSVDSHDPEAPFGPLDVDVKAYFRTVDLQIRDWQENREENAGEEEDDPNEKKSMFFMAALNEMRGKEKQFATDPECSVILERMLHSMDDFVRRVFFDSLAGSYATLMRHRFASHVCQTLFTVARDTIHRETKGIVLNVPTTPEKGELRTLTRLVLDICEELIPDISSAITHPYASHVIRSLLLLLSPNVADSQNAQSSVRSKKSAAWKSKQGQMKSVFDVGKGKGLPPSAKSCPQEFHEMARRLLQAVRDEADENEIRAMAANKVACPMLEILLEVEADQNLSDEAGSFMDAVAVGIISACQNSSINEIRESDYLGTLIRDANASHVLEALVSRCPATAFDVIWRTYFEGKLARLTVHPVANYVVAKTLERVSLSQLDGALQELDGTWRKLIQLARIGVITAVVERAAVLKASNLASLPPLLLSAFGIKDQSKFLVPCILTICALPDYQKALSSQTAAELPSNKNQGNYKRTETSNSLEPKIQGSLLLQSLLKLPEPLNQFVVDSILEMTVDERTSVAHNATGSRIFDVFFDSPTISSQMKRRLVMDFIGHYDRLVDDKFGSRVGDRCWAFADTYLKEKIARSVMPHEQALAASFYGKFFSRKLNIHLLQRKPDAWRDLQSERRETRVPAVQPTSTTTVDTPVTVIEPEKKSLTTTPPRNRKRKARNEDEIDALFSEKLGRTIKKAALPADGIPPPPAKAKQAPQTKDKDLEQVLGSLRSGQTVEGSPSRKKKRR